MVYCLILVGAAKPSMTGSERNQSPAPPLLFQGQRHLAVEVVEQLFHLADGLGQRQLKLSFLACLVFTSHSSPSALFLASTTSSSSFDDLLLVALGQRRFGRFAVFDFDIIKALLGIQVCLSVCSFRSAASFFGRMARISASRALISA